MSYVTPYHQTNAVSLLKNLPRYYNGAKQLYTLAKKSYAAGQRAGKYVKSFVPNATKPVTPTYGRKQTGKRTFVRKQRKLNKLVGKPVPKKSVYERKRKTMRRYNSGKLSLQQRLQNGGALPNTTFARLFWRGSRAIAFGCIAPGAPVGTSSAQVRIRTMCLNDISQSPNYAASLNQPITYAPMWKSLYNKFLVLGAKLKVKINPTYYPERFATTTNTDSTSDSKVPRDAQPGYWYIRAYYKRNKDGEGEVGHPIKPSADGEDPHQENWWPNLREFLSDPTVTYVKDVTNVKTKMHVHHTANILDNASGPISNPPTTNFSYEIETSTKPVYLTCNFSAKKHFQDKNTLTDRDFISWDESLAIDQRFEVRFGYIGFNSVGNVAYHIPIDRNTNRMCEMEVQYFVALREPKITPHDDTIPASSARIAYEEPDEEMMAILDL